MVDVVTSHMESPKSIAVYPAAALIFWTDLGRIERSGLDGDSRRVIVEDHVKQPHGICIDAVQRRIYWVDVGLQSLSSCDLEGGSLRSLTSQSDPLQSASLSVLEDWLYSAQLVGTNVSIRRYNKMEADQDTLITTQMVR